MPRLIRRATEEARSVSGISVGNAPCSWGVLEFDLDGQAAGYAQVLDEMRQAGYAGTELGDWGFMPAEPDALRQEMEGRGLSMLGAFVPVSLANVDAHADGVALALKTARLLAPVNKEAFIVLADENGTDPTRTKNAGHIEPSEGLSEPQWATFASGAAAVARAVLEKTGLRTVFHHHCAGYVETPAEVATLLERTDASLLGLCLDMGHYAYGGGDPREALEKHADRIWHVHYKDCHPEIAARARSEEWDYFEAVKHGVFCELGQGTVDFPSITETLNERGYQDWIVVEQDVLPGMGTPIESASRNREYLRTLGL